MEYNKIWQQALSVLLENSKEDDIKPVFLKRLIFFDFFDSYFIFITSSKQVKAWVEKNYQDEIEKTLSQIFECPIQIRISLQEKDESSFAEKRNVSDNFYTQKNSVVPTNPIQNNTFKKQTISPYNENTDWLNTYVKYEDLPHFPTNIPLQQNKIGPQKNGLFKKCTFENFVVGDSNRFAYNAALGITERPGVVNNPLFIYGDSGLGKTHLLVAIANYVMQNLPYLKTIYVDADTFVTDYVDASRHNSWNYFNKTYHEVDFLLLDDVQILENKEGTIDQVFKIFNELKNQNKQVVLSADRAPHELNMDERMSSRFASGLTIDVEPPNYEMRLAIIKNYLDYSHEAMGITEYISDDILNFIAEKSGSNIREIEGSLNKLIIYMNSSQITELSTERVKELLKDYFPDSSTKRISIGLIQTEVEHAFKISHSDIISSKRSKDIALARHVAIYLSRYLTEESLENIGKYFGGRDHTTIMHSINKIEKNKQNNRGLYEKISYLEKKIKKQ